MCRRPGRPRHLSLARGAGGPGVSHVSFPDVALHFSVGRSTSMDFRPLNDTERRQLVGALRGNAESDRAILMDRRDTSFAGTTDDVTDEEVIFAIKSVPCHY